jgi:hypothetical protein
MLNIRPIDKNTVLVETGSTSVFLTRTLIDNIRIGNSDSVFIFTIEHENGEREDIKAKNIFIKEIK